MAVRYYYIGTIMSIDVCYLHVIKAYLMKTLAQGLKEITLTPFINFHIMYGCIASARNRVAQSKINTTVKTIA